MNSPTNLLPGGVATAPAVLQGCREACLRLEAVAELARRVDVLPAAECAGPHLRHALEHVTGLLDGIEAGRVDYSARARESGLERPDALIDALAPVRARLERLGGHDLEARLDVIDFVAPGRRARVASTVARELAFVASHVMHHVALAAMRLAQSGIEVPESLYLAFSTRAHLDDLERVRRARA